MKDKESEEIKQNANRIMAHHLRDKTLPDITDAVYAVAGTVEIKLEIKRPLRRENKTKENRRVRKMRRQRKEWGPLVEREWNEIY